MLTFPSEIDRITQVFGARPAIIDREARLSWAEHTDRIRRAGAMLMAHGIGRGERFGIVALNSFRQAELMYGGYWIGAVPVPVNFRLAPVEMRFILEDAGCKRLFGDDANAPHLASDELAQWRDGAIGLGELPKHELPVYEALISDAAPAPGANVDEDEDATLLYTGGTTGRSKGVRLSHKNLIANAMQVALETRARGDEIFLHVAPMFHAADTMANHVTVVGGAHVYLDQFTPQGVLGAIRDFGVTRTLLTPTMIIVTLQAEDFASYDISSLRTIQYGSAPLAVEWVKRALDQFGAAELVQMYGLTETSPILTVADDAWHRDAVATDRLGRLKSGGRAVVGVELRIADANDDELPAGEVGEVLVRGPNVTKGYLNLPEVNAEVFRNGWFHTGDMGKLDESGYLYLMDRKKDMIITGGENVYSSEVEAVLYQHPGVSECAVIGVPDEKYGEALFAAIVPAPAAALDEDEIVAHCRGKIGGYKIPRRMTFLEELPKSAVGKILKTELRKTYGAD